MTPDLSLVCFFRPLPSPQGLPALPTSGLAHVVCLTFQLFHYLHNHFQALTSLLPSELLAVSWVDFTAAPVPGIFILALVGQFLNAKCFVITKLLFKKLIQA
jgi:hypothetical protein